MHLPILLVWDSWMRSSTRSCLTSEYNYYMNASDVPPLGLELELFLINIDWLLRSRHAFHPLHYPL